MLGDVLVLLRDELNAHLRQAAPDGGADAQEDRVQLIDGGQGEPIEFRADAVSVLLVNIEQEPHLRNADPYLRDAADPGLRRLAPEIRLNLYLLFVARFKAYERGLNLLALVLRYFQTHRALDRASHPALPAEVDKLVCELVTLPLAEQNEIWSALRIHYHPSLLYRVRMVVLRDAEGAAVPPIGQTVVRARQRT